MSTVHISPATFAQVFRRFQQQVEHDEDSAGPFRDFQSGLAYLMEHYKEWLYLEARRRLNVEAWRKNWIGTGKIMPQVVKAIEIYEDDDHRNNIVDWKGKRGPSSRGHLKLLAARDDPRQWPEAEKALWDMFATKDDPQSCFERLVELFGGRYDLISYLFFIRDWNEFVPVKPSFFPEVFELLGVPHKTVKRCNWSNYTGVLDRFREVQRHLEGYQIPNGVRLIDAHSFCWMAITLEVPSDTKAPTSKILPWIPEAGDAPARGAGAGTSQKDLEEIQRNQKRIGDLAQAIVLDAERLRLRKAGRADLAKRVDDVSKEVSLGYDIASFTLDGRPRPIEVKAAARLGRDCRFFLSENERLKAQSLPDYHFVLVFDVESKKPHLREVAAHDLPPEALHPVQYEVRLRKP